MKTVKQNEESLPKTETKTALDAILTEMADRPESLTPAVIRHWILEALREIKELRNNIEEAYQSGYGQAIQDVMSKKVDL